MLALLHKPKIVYLDELATGLDKHNRNEVRVCGKNCCEKFKMNMILVSHDIEEIEYITDRIMILQNRKLKVDINKSKLKKYPKCLDDLLNKYM